MSNKRIRKEKENQDIVDWTEYAHSISRPLNPRREMLSERGYCDRKSTRDGMVTIRYDVPYIAWWIKKFLLTKLNVSKQELFDIISGKFDLNNRETFSVMSQYLQPFETSIPGLGRTDFAEFFQFLTEESKAGRFWMIFDNFIDRCLFITDNAEPGRLVVPNNQYIGRNRRKAWRDSMDEYHQLQHLLRTEKIAPSFEYDYYRLDDSFAHNQKSFYLIEGLWGTQCRASVSEGWELLQPAPTWDDDEPGDLVPSRRY